MKPFSRYETAVVVTAVAAGLGVAATAALATSMEIDGKFCIWIVGDVYCV